MQAFPVVVGQRLAHALTQGLQQLGGCGAVKHYGIKVQKGCARHHAMRQRPRSMGDPGTAVLQPRGLQHALVVGGHGVEAMFAKALLQLPQGCLADELRRGLPRLGRCQRQRGHRARIAMQAAVQVRVDDQPATHKGVHEQVQQAGDVAPAALQQFGHAGGRGVFGKAHGQLGHLLHLLGQVDVVPGFGLRLGQPQHAVPAAQLERRGHAHAHHARAQRTQAVEQLIQVCADGGQQHVNVGEGVVEHHALTHVAGEVDQQPVGAAAADLDADGKRAVGVQSNGHRGLAHAATHRGFAAQQLVFVQPGGDEANGLRREARDARHLGLGQAAVGAQSLQHHALVELAQPYVVGAALAQQGRAVAGRFAQVYGWWGWVSFQHGGREVHTKWPSKIQNRSR